ncbi:MAG TPA: cupin domain-containing protein [Xanthobacteraceae bacterium]|jgi:mannose-6-phosphate isomerase-like protein (cupin superfamily)|nr:cupin domain-containing protein [Xanthobacteraceae bacterium]
MTEKKATVFRQSDIKVFDRGNGVTTKLFCNEKRCGAQVTTGTTTLPAGRSVALHYHNCDEQIVILSGQADVEVHGQRRPIGPMEVAYIPQGEVHCFHNTGEAELVMLFVYDAGEVTRTFAATGETVVHLDEGDLAQPKS